ncbi:hypothetical protein ACJX0J_011610, partial [Zea mays]
MFFFFFFTFADVLILPLFQRELPANIEEKDSGAGQAVCLLHIWVATIISQNYIVSSLRTMPTDLLFIFFIFMLKMYLNYNKKFVEKMRPLYTTADFKERKTLENKERKKKKARIASSFTEHVTFDVATAPDWDLFHWRVGYLFGSSLVRIFLYITTAA